MTDNIEQNLLLSSSRFLRFKEYWVDKLSGDLSETKLLLPERNYRDRENRTERINIHLSDHVSARAVAMSKNSDLSIYLILLTGLKTLMHRYTLDTDIFTVSPVYQKNASKETLNDVILIRDRMDETATFKETLLAVRQSTLEAYDNQDYPFDKLMEHFIDPDSRYGRGGGMLSDTVCLLTNIHHPVETGEDKPYHGIVFSFAREGETIHGEILYPSHMYKRFYLEQVARHFSGIMGESLRDIDIKISEISLMSGEEKERLLVNFNNTGAPYPRFETIHGLFETQVEKTPGNTALVYEDGPGAGRRELTYRELNEKINRAARALRERGVKPGTVVGVIVDHPLWMVVGLMAVLKAGGAYLPMDPGHPAPRNKYVLRNAGVRLLAVQKELIAQGEELLKSVDMGTVFTVDDEAGHSPDASNPVNVNKHNKHNKHSDPAYVMYTSGTTGKPRGVVIEHQNVVNLLSWFGRVYPLGAGDNVLQLTDYTFDPSVEDIFGTLVHGAVLHVGSKELIADRELFRRYVEENRIHSINFIPTILKELLGRGEKLESLRVVISGGERLDDSLKDRLIETGYTLYNNYGPTETSTDALSSRCSGAAVTLGGPISNVKCYILNRNRLMPAGAAGELCIAGAGVGRGYLNDPALTAEKFVPSPFGAGERMYLTGDLARRLPDGTVEFLGRVDQQVKIRGYRIELEEIKQRLLARGDIKDAVVIAREDGGEEKSLIAYFLSDDGAQNRTAPPGGKELRKYLAAALPDYMIPSYFVQLDSIPLTGNGKVDTRALPQPAVKKGGKHTPPGNEIEEKLVEIWSELLETEKENIGIDANFFELGGHSLRAILLISRQHNAFNVKVPLSEIFERPTVRELAAYIKDAMHDEVEGIEPVEKKEYYPMSSVQKRMYFFHRLDAADTSYNMFQALEIHGDADREKLAEAFKQLVRRHEILRTSYEMVDGEPVQRVRENVDFQPEYFPPGETDIREVIKEFVRPFALDTVPMIRVGLIKKDDGKDILMVDIPHQIVDINSQDVLIRDFVHLYRGERLPELPVQYKDFTQWQNQLFKSPAIKKQETYWLNRFKGDIPAGDLPTDHPRPEKRTADAGWVDFTIEDRLYHGLRELASQSDATMYMVLMAAVNILISRVTGREDIVVGFPSAGRSHIETENVLGMFVNMLALRNFPGAGKTFHAFLAEVRKNLMDAYENQDYPFEELVTALKLERDLNKNPLFNFVFAMGDAHTPAPPPGNTGITVGPYASHNETARFDLTLFAQTSAHGLTCTLRYSTALFKKETAERMVNHYLDILYNVVENPGIPLEDLQISSHLVKGDALDDEDEIDFNF